MVPSNGTKGLPPRTDIVSVVGHVRKVPILLQKSKVDQPRRRGKRSFLSGVGDGAARGAHRRAECVFDQTQKLPRSSSHEALLGITADVGKRKHYDR